MRLSQLFLLGALLSVINTARAQTPASKSSSTAPTLDHSEVRITYGELKRLVAATLPPSLPPVPKPTPPVPAALLSSVYRLDITKATLVAELQAENFDGGWHAIPIAGASAGVISAQPPEARVVFHEGCLCLITDKAGATSLKLIYPLAPEEQGTTVTLGQAAITSLELTGLPEGKAVRMVCGNNVRSLTNNGISILPASGGDVTFIVEDEKPASEAIAATGAATDDAIVSKATYTTEVVRDGSVFTEGSFTVRHDLPVRLALQIPKDAKLLQCHVNGALVRPMAKADGAIEIPLDDPATDGAESEVKLSFTSAFPALQPAEGEITLALPQIPLFARQIDWTVQMPVGFDLIVTGNVEQITKPSTANAEVHLRKSLCRNQQPEARVLYRKN